MGVSLSDGVIFESNQSCYEHLSSTESSIKLGLLSSPVMHNDETGMRTQKALQWVHTSSSELYTHYAIHQKRGQEAIDSIGILPVYEGISVHDRYASYNDYKCEHGFCNAHLLRELKGLSEQARTWTKEMATLLCEANESKKTNQLSPELILTIEQKYDDICKKGLLEEPMPAPSIIKKRGRTAKPKGLRLLETFTNAKTKIMRFMHNPKVPFDNNLAERDLRMVKLKQKISGCFRTEEGAKVFCRIRGYISTVKKQGLPVFEAIKLAIEGNPVVLYTAEQ